MPGGGVGIPAGIPIGGGIGIPVGGIMPGGGIGIPAGIPIGGGIGIPAGGGGNPAGPEAGVRRFNFGALGKVLAGGGVWGAIIFYWNGVEKRFLK